MDSSGGSKHSICSSSIRWRWIGAVLVFLMLCAATLVVRELASVIVQHVLQTILLGGLMLGCRDVDAGRPLPGWQSVLGFQWPQPEET